MAAVVVEGKVALFYSLFDKDIENEYYPYFTTLVVSTVELVGLALYGMVLV